MAPSFLSSNRSPFHLLAKPTGALCNLDCSYCFYLKKTALYPQARSFRMSPEVLETFVRDYIESQDGPEVQFAWQGGEPTLLGLDFFREARALQDKYAGGRRITNAIQTNGTLLDDDWGRFLRHERFLVGISIDGPPALHDAHRQDKGGRPTLDRVLAGLRVLQKHQVEYNILTVVSSTNAPHPARVYRFLRGTGAKFLQFIPLVEQAAPVLPSAATAASVRARAWGDFLCGVFDEWARRDVGRIFVQAFDTALASWLGLPSPLCVHAETCGRCLAVEHNGDVYSCDHYVDSAHRLGNLGVTPLLHLVNAPDQTAFGRAKETELAPACRACVWRFACNGGCPKHRFAADATGAPLNHLCAGYRRFFKHVDPWMRDRAARLRQAP